MLNPALTTRKKRKSSRRRTAVRQSPKDAPPHAEASRRRPETAQPVAKPTDGLFARFWYAPILVVYAVLVGYVASLHRPWFDEAQAWLIARDCDLRTMFSEVLRWEGHPALWYLILKAVIFLHLPYEAIGLLSGGIATIGVWLLLAKSPFPKWLAASLPFTYCLCYQYAVIARSYVLLPLLLFATAVLEDKKWQWPIRWSLCLLLIGNVCVHTFGVACGLVLVHLLELGSRWRSLDPSAKKRQAAALLIWVVGMLLVVVVLWPAKDNVAAFGVNRKLDLFYATLNAIDNATLECPMLTAAFLAASCYWFWRTGVLLVYLIISLPVLGIFLWLRVFDHHHGILFLLWLYVFWRSMAAFVAMRQRGGVDRRRRVEWAAMMVLVAGLVVRQTVWTGQSVMLEREVSYCGAAALAKFIQAHDLTKYRIAGVRYENAAVLPYFPQNIFMNFPNEGGRCYVDWSQPCRAPNKAFSVDASLNSLNEPCDVLVWPSQGTATIPTPWEDPELLSRLPKDWCFVAHFDGQLIYHTKGHLTVSSSQSVFARRRVVVEQGLTVIERDESRKCAYRAIPTGFSEACWTAAHSAQFHLDFGDLLSKIDPEESLRQYQFALALVSRVRSPELSSIEEKYLTWIAASAHGNIGAAVAGTRLKLAVEHLWRASQLDPENPIVYRNLAAALELAGQKQGAIDALRCTLKLAPDDAKANAMLRRLSKGQTNGSQ
jgi:tetratricopeptide (TPR) repeat protein